MAIPSWLYTAAFLFVLFLIFNDPGGAGDTAGNFAGFVVELLGAVGEFLTGLFEGTNDGGVGGTGTEAPTAPATESGVSVGDSFTHEHDGLGQHTHALNE